MNPKYTEMPNATHARMQTIAGSAILNMAYEMLQLTCIQFGIENTNAVSMMRRARCMQNR